MATYQITTDKGTYEVETDGLSNTADTSLQGQAIAKQNNINAQKSVADAQANINKLDPQVGAIGAAYNFSWPVSALIKNVIGQGNTPVPQATTGGGRLLQDLGALANPLNGEALSLTGKALSKASLPKIYNDVLINSTGQSAVSKIQAAIIPLREKYKAATEPFINKPVDSETFQEALSVVPKEMQKDLGEKYGSIITDNKGNPHTTVGNLQKMELGLKDDIQQPKYGQSINAASYNVSEAAKKIKQIRLSQYPQATQDTIVNLDKKFGPVINMTDYLLPKLSNRAGAINTKTLYQIFNNPSDAGTRQYLTGLKGLGVDLTPEISTLKGWVARQRIKSFIKGVTGKVAEGATIGTVVKSAP